MSLAVLPCDKVVTLEPAELYCAVLGRFQRQVGTPLIVYEIVQDVISRLRIHILVEQTREGRLAGDGTAIYQIPPCDAHHGRMAEPNTV